MEDVAMVMRYTFVERSMRDAGVNVGGGEKN